MLRSVQTLLTTLRRMKEIVLRIDDAAFEKLMGMLSLCPSVEVVDVNESAVLSCGPLALRIRESIIRLREEHLLCKMYDYAWLKVAMDSDADLACQRHYFGAMAKAYFDNKLKEASVNVQRKQKTIDGFSRLPDEFTMEDVVRCFNLGCSSSARTKIMRLTRDHLVEKIREERGLAPALYHKTDTIIL